MAHKLEWIEDTDSYMRNMGGAGTVRINDSYAQWNLKPQGHDFALSNELPIEGDQDFRFVEAVTSLVDDGELQIQADPIVLFDFEGGTFEPRSGEPGDKVTFFAPLPIRERSVARADATIVDPEFTDWTDEGVDRERVVALGIIDDAINIAHERFQDSCGRSRVEFAWIQDATAPHPSSTVRFGREFTRTEISDAIARFGPDEEAILRHLQLVGQPGAPYRPSALNFRASHGTHVADLAAGYDPAETDVNQRLITVQLPALVTQDTSGGSLVAAMLSAVRYIFARALAMSKTLQVPVPVVLCTSYSLSGGDRSGRGILEKAIRTHAGLYRLATRKWAPPTAAFGAPVEVLAPAGNAHLSRCHAVSTVAEGAPDAKLDVILRVQPQDRTSSFMEAWVTNRVDEVRVTIAPPGDTPHETFVFELNDPSGRTPWLLVEKGKATNVVCRLSLDDPFEQSPGTLPWDTLRYRILIAIAPTTVLDSPRLPAPAGAWGVTIETDTDQDRIYAWIQRDADMPGFGRRSRQAYFEDPAYDTTRYDAAGRPVIDDVGLNTHVRRNGTISSLSTYVAHTEGGETDPMIDTISVGAIRWDNDAGALYSAAGKPVGSPDDMRAPCVAAFSETSVVLRNSFAAGSRSGTSVALSGTSFAVPRVARCLAMELSDTALAERPDFDGRAFLATLQATSTAPPSHAETAHHPPLRPQRLLATGVALSTVDAIAPGLVRGSYRKH